MLLLLFYLLFCCKRYDVLHVSRDSLFVYDLFRTINWRNQDCYRISGNYWGLRRNRSKHYFICMVSYCSYQFNDITDGFSVFYSYDITLNFKILIKWEIPCVFTKTDKCNLIQEMAEIPGLLYRLLLRWIDKNNTSDVTIIQKLHFLFEV